MFETLLSIHLLSMAAGVGTSILMAVMGARTARQPATEMTTIMLAAGDASGIVSGVAVALLWLSGLAMVLLYPGVAASGGDWFIAKIILVVVLTGLVVLIHRQSARLKRGDNVDAAMAALRRSSGIVLLLSLAIPILAVLAFD